MSATKSDFPADKTEEERRKNLSGREIEDLELAGGVEGGMQAGSAGGPGERDVGRDAPGQSPPRSSDKR